MIIEWYALKVFSLGLLLGYLAKKRLVEYNKTKCYEIKEFKRRKV